ncbi:hypothetical protein Lser_V15G13163 [Lactuca serriola]
MDMTMVTLLRKIITGHRKLFMTRGSNSSLIPPLESPESSFHKNKDKSEEDTPRKLPFKSLKSVFGKKKGKKVGESSNTKEDTEYETEKEESVTDFEESDHEKESDNIMEIPFTEKDYEDAYKHLHEVNDIADYFNITNVPRETVLLRMLHVAFKGDAKDWLKALPLEEITTWAIANFEQVGESLFEAWDRYKGLLRNCPQNDLNVQQEVSTFYDGVNVTTRQLVDSQVPLTKKNTAEVKRLIEEFSKNSREYHNPRHESTRGLVNSVNDSMAVVMAKLATMERRMTKMDQSIHAIRVGCENCSRPHLTKDCDLDENGNRKAQVCYPSGDKYDEDWRKPRKEWLPYDEYKKAKEEKYKMKTRGFFQKEEPVQEKKLDFEDMITRLAAASEKRHNETDDAIREQQLMMKEQQELMRNQQASILNIEKQLSQLAQQVYQRATSELPSNPEKNPRIAHVNVITTSSENYFPTLKPIHEQEAKVELENEEILDLLRAFQVNNPCVETLLHSPKYASLLKELLTNRKNMEEGSEIVLDELPEKMGDTGSITILCQFGNLVTTHALADSGASINIMPYPFFKKLNLPELKPIHMTITFS